MGLEVLMPDRMLPLGTTAMVLINYKVTLLLAIIGTTYTLNQITEIRITILLREDGVAVTQGQQERLCLKLGGFQTWKTRGIFQYFLPCSPHHWKTMAPK